MNWSVWWAWGLLPEYASWARWQLPNTIKKDRVKRDAHPHRSEVAVFSFREWLRVVSPRLTAR